jgi:hypothetical protein
VLCCLACTYHWIRLYEEVYALSRLDSVWIATIYPARNASRITPAEALRDE